MGFAASVRTSPSINASPVFVPSGWRSMYLLPPIYPNSCNIMTCCCIKSSVCVESGYLPCPPDAVVVLV